MIDFYLVVILCVSSVIGDHRPMPGDFSNTWALKVVGGLGKAQEIAQRNGLICRGQIGSLQDMYLFEMVKGPLKEMAEVTHKLSKENEVIFVEQQKYSYNVPKLQK